MRRAFGVHSAPMRVVAGSNLCPRSVRFARSIAFVGVSAMCGCAAAVDPSGARDAAADVVATDGLSDVPDEACDMCLDRDFPRLPLCADARVCGIGPLSPPEVS